MSTEFELIVYVAVAVVLFLLFNHFLPLRQTTTYANEEQSAKMNFNNGII